MFCFREKSIGLIAKQQNEKSTQITSLYYKVCYSLYTYQRDLINMNNFKNIIKKERIQISIIY